MQRPAPTSSRHAFTLVELLVVIAIIVILMSLLLTAIPAVKEAARKTDARNTANQIVVALNAYYTEYAKFPPIDPNNTKPPKDTDPDTVVGDDASGATEPNNTVFYTLRAIAAGPNTDNDCNPRKVVFFEGKAATVNNANVARGGFFDKTNNGGVAPANFASCLFDPWGKQYGVVMDTNGDDRIDLTNFYNDFSGIEPTAGRAPRKKVGAFSMGKDNKLGDNGNRSYRNGTEKSDDVLSWEE